MWTLIGLVAGALAGQALWHEWGAVLGGLVGFFIGASLSGNRQRNAFRKPPDAAAGAGAPAAARIAEPALAERVAQLERRLAALEAQRHPAFVDAASAAVHAAPAGAAAAFSAAPPAALIAAEPPAEMIPAPPPDVPAAAVPAAARAGTGMPRALATIPSTASAPASNALGAWLTGGNALTRIGVVVLFFGVAFLLRYFAEHIELTIAMKLSAVALAGIALIGLGGYLAPARPGYGLSLQGAGVGVLYLTTYAALRLYAVLPEQTAVLVLVAISTLAVALALRADSQPLAGLAVAGGFLSPILAEAHGAPTLLFGYFAVLNGAIFALAWFRTWRVLNVEGFIFTLGLGLYWGAQFYVPAYFAAVEPFLVLFVGFYVAIVMLEARHDSEAANRPLAGLLVFGAPLAGFACQAAMLRDTAYGAAWSALALALAYGALFLILRRRAESGYALLAKAFLALAVIFATLAIPFAFRDQWTVGLWAIEAAGVYWLAVQQRSRSGRIFALVVLLATGAAFAWMGPAPDDARWFTNAGFVAALLIALSAITIAWLSDRAGDGLPASEKRLAALPLAWGFGWWVAAGALEMTAHFDAATASHATLAWVCAGVAAALSLRRPLAWPRVAWAGAVLLPVLAWTALRDFSAARTTLDVYGWLVFPLAWAVQWWGLRALEPLPDAGAGADESARRMRHSGLAHAVCVLALTAQLAWEAGAWAGRYTLAHTAWVACASALPAVLCLLLVTRWREAPFWPFAAHGEAYAVGAGSPIAALLAVWFVAANVLSPGDASPLAYVPLFNPLELTLALSLFALFAWARRFAPLSERALYGWAGVALFIGLNGVALRTCHHWGDVPWRLSALLASKPLQAALTLTWTLTALALMFAATRTRLRSLWMTGAVLLAVVIGKLFLIDLNTLSGLPRVVSFLGVGALLLVVGYLSPLPPAAGDDGGPLGERPD